jgi:hypothetical protein
LRLHTFIFVTHWPELQLAQGVSSHSGVLDSGGCNKIISEGTNKVPANETRDEYYWYARAEETWEIANKIKDMPSRIKLRMIAALYERLGHKAARAKANGEAAPNFQADDSKS